MRFVSNSADIMRTVRKRSGKIHSFIIRKSYFTLVIALKLKSFLVSVRKIKKIQNDDGLTLNKEHFPFLSSKKTDRYDENKWEARCLLISLSLCLP